MEKYPIFKFKRSDIEYQLITEDNCDLLANYMKSNNLKRLIITYNENGPGWNSTTTPDLKEFDFIEELLVYWTHINNIENIHYCINLKVLWLDNSDNTAIRFECFPYLEKFISWNRKKIDKVWDVPTLKEVTLTGLTPTMFKSGLAIKSIQKLRILSSTIEDICFLEGAYNLSYLELRGLNKLTNLSLISNLKKLEYLDLDTKKVSDYSFIAFLENLQVCYIGIHPSKYILRD